MTVKHGWYWPVHLGCSIGETDINPPIDIPGTGQAPTFKILILYVIFLIYSFRGSYAADGVMDG
jgi:hypothetical protein